MSPIYWGMQSPIKAPATVTTLLGEAVAAFLKAVGAGDYVRDAGRGPDGAEAFGSVTCAAPEWNGELCVAPDSAFVDRTFRPPGMPTPYLRRAWVAEMANQVIGILQGRLARHGVALTFGFPRLDAHPMNPANQTVVLQYRSGDSWFRVYLQTSVAADQALPDICQAELEFF